VDRRSPDRNSPCRRIRGLDGRSTRAIPNVDADGVFWFTGMDNKDSTWSTRIAAFKSK